MRLKYIWCLIVAYPVQVSGHQLVSVPVSSTNAMYQTVVAANLHSGEGNQVQVGKVACFFCNIFAKLDLLPQLILSTILLELILWIH